MTYTDKEGDHDEHCCQVDGYHGLEVTIFIKVCTVADEVEDNGRDDDVEDDTKEFSPKSDLNVDFLVLLLVDYRHHVD